MATLITKERPTDFLARRIVRIYPTFLLCTAFTMLVLFPQVIQRWVPLSVTLAPMDDATYLMRVEWTIVHEIFFYLVVFCFATFGIQRWVPVFAVIWIVVLIAAAYLRIPMPAIGRANIGAIGLMSANVGFAAGLLIPTILKRLSNPLLGVSIFVTFLFTQYNFSAVYVRVFAGIGSAFLIVSALQRPVNPPRVVHLALTKLGDWSYAIYLIHVPILTYIFTVYRGENTPWFAWPVATALALAMGALLGEIDQVLTEKGKSLVKGSSLKVLNVAAVTFIAVYLGAAVLSLIFNLAS